MLDDRRRTVFLFPGIFGEEETFDALCDALSLLFDVRIAPYPGPTASNGLLMDLDATGASFASWVLSIACDEPALIVGYSYGANLAFEVASRVQTAGHRVALLSLLDPALPTTEFEVHQRGPAVARVDVRVQRPELLYRSRLLRSALLGLCRLASARTRQRVERRTLWKLRSYARRAWRPRGLDCPVLHIMTEQFAPAVAEGWVQLCPDIRQIGIGNRHVDLLKGIALSEVVRTVSGAIGIASARRGAPPICMPHEALPARTF